MPNRLVAEANWQRHAAFRLRAFILGYLGSISLIVIAYTVYGLAVTFGLMIGLIPIPVLIAIRIYGAAVKR